MKKALPPHAKLSKESKMCIQECVSEFISFITSGAADKCLKENRKTLNGEDILYALQTLGFENYAETLKIYLAKYRQHESLDSDERRRKDRLKRQLRKERKEKEFQEIQTKIDREKKSTPNDAHIDPYNDSQGYSDDYKDKYFDETNDEIKNNYTITPSQMEYDGFTDIIGKRADQNYVL